ncbi:MAG: MarR family transcriptional regulator [Candidatus Latescibacteria bacterium]|nr:MarR family transcriptional regulator [Candidatus Latescibacterota bacterium]
MKFYEELGFLKPFKHKDHETLLNIVVTSTLLVKEAQQILRPLGLTDAQFNVLLILIGQSENGRLNQTELGKMLLVNRSNVTGLIDRMERDGFVERIPEPGDRRINLVQITEAGKTVLKKAQEIYYKRIEEIISALSPREGYQLCETLKKIRSGI